MPKKSKILLGLLLVLVAIRAVLPVIILPPLNDYLKTAFPAYVFHIEDLDISIIRGAYRLEGFTGKLKQQTNEFIKVNYVDVSLSWRELFKGRILTDIIADGLNFELTQELIASTKSLKKDDATKTGKEAKDKLFPLKVARVDLRNSELKMTDVNGLPPELQLFVTGLEGRLSNALGAGNTPALFVGKASLMNSGSIKLVGELNQNQKSAEWNFDIEMRDFELAKLNPILKRKAPLTFDTGHMDIYSEVKSENDKIVGYAKPFLKKATFVGDQGDFKGIKHFGIEIGSASLNAILKNPDVRSVATKVNFGYQNGDFSWDLMDAIGKAIKHGFRDAMEPGIENTLTLNTNKPKEIAHD